MRKIPTLFRRDPDDNMRITREVTAGCGWVIDGEGVATRKYDGTCVIFDDIEWWARREVKRGKPAPAFFVPISTDSAAGKMIGWEPITESGFAKWHADALNHVSPVKSWEPGTYELIGPEINGNPEGSPFHLLVRHATALRLREVPRTFNGLREYLLDVPDMEGIVWHHGDGRMAKLKRKDFQK